ncbi:aconitase X, partial [Methanobrevibacter boviskoreani]
YFKLQDQKVKNENLKALGAALASSGAVALYQVENITPEYKNMDIENAEETITITKEDIEDTKAKLSTSNEVPDLVCLGCPHASLEEIKDLAAIVEGKKIRNELWICTSVNIKAAAERMGYLKAIEEAGGHIVCDTCMVVAPIEDLGYKVIGVNSAKAANYVPNMGGIDVVYDEAENLIQFE